LHGFVKEADSTALQHVCHSRHNGGIVVRPSRIL
jgi:hypothetical protein